MKKIITLTFCLMFAWGFSQTTYNANDKVSIEENGKWYPGVILEVKGSEYKIHYDGYASTYDTWVTTNRIKSTGPAAVATGEANANARFKIGDVILFMNGGEWTEGDIASEISAAGRYQVHYGTSGYTYVYPKDMKPSNKKNILEAQKDKVATYGYIYQIGEQVWANAPEYKPDNFIATVTNTTSLGAEGYYNMSDGNNSVKVKPSEIKSKYDASNASVNQKMNIPTNSFPVPQNGEIIEYIDIKDNVCDISTASFCRVYKPAGPNQAVNGDIAYYFKNGQLNCKCKVIYIDKINCTKDKAVGLVKTYKKDGTEDQFTLYDEKGVRLRYGNVSEMKDAKYKFGEKVQILEMSGDQDIWIPGVVEWPENSLCYVSYPLYHGWSNTGYVYLESIRAANIPITTKYKVTPGAPDAHVQALAKKELLALRPGATIIKNDMNGSAWQITLGLLKIPDFRKKDGFLLYKMPDGELRCISFTYSERYITGSGYEKKNELDFLTSEMPIGSY